MPELPEVETVCRSLANKINGKTIQNVTLNRTKLRFPIPLHFAENINNQRVVDVIRRAKYGLIFLSNEQVIVFHLGMSGRFRYQPLNSVSYEKHDHVLFHFNDGVLAFNDARRFGLLDVIPQQALDGSSYFIKMAPDPFEPTFTYQSFFKSLTKRNITIKQALLDQTIIAGVGNIYACEALFLSKIHPQTICANLTLSQAQILFSNVQKILTKAIQAGGSTLRDHQDVQGKSGYFQFNFQVYQQANKPCVICKTPIENLKISGRSTFFCPKCQLK